MKINVICPKCEEKLIVEISESAPTDQEIESQKYYTQVVDSICAIAWEAVNE